MRFAFVTTEYPGLTGEDGGLSRHVQRMTRALVDAGHECAVFVANPHLDSAVCERERDDRVQLVIVKGPREIPTASPLHDLDIPKEFAWVEDGIRAAWAAGDAVAKHHAERRFDAVQVANLMFLALFQQIDVPLLLRFSSYDPMWRRAAGRLLSPAGLVDEYLEREAAYCADACFAPSEFLARKLERELRLPVRVVRPPAYLECPEWQWDWPWWKKEIEPLGPYLAFAGSISRAKGCHIISQAFPLALKRNGSLRLHLAGRDQGQLASLKAACPGHVHHHGSLPHERLYPLLSRSLAVLAPSLVENLSNSVIEAMLVGRPVITTEGTSGEELVGEGRGVLVPPEDAHALAQAILGIAAASDEDRTRMGLQAQAFVKEELGQARSLSQWLATVEELRSRGPIARAPAAHRLRQILPNLRSFAELDRRFAATARWRERYQRLASTPLLRQLLTARRWLAASPDPLTLPDE